MISFDTLIHDISLVGLVIVLIHLVVIFVRKRPVSKMEIDHRRNMLKNLFVPVAYFSVVNLTVLFFPDPKLPVFQTSTYFENKLVAVLSHIPSDTWILAFVTFLLVFFVTSKKT